MKVQLNILLVDKVKIPPTLLLVDKVKLRLTILLVDKVKVPLTFLLVDEVMLDVVVFETLEVGYGRRSVMQVIMCEVVEDVAERNSGRDCVSHTERKGGQEQTVDTHAKQQGRRWGEDETTSIHRGLETPPPTVVAIVVGHCVSSLLALKLPPPLI